MLGYIKPWQDELKVKDLRRYRAVYCGVCKQIAALNTQFERMAVSYDTTFLAIFLLAFVEDEPESRKEACIARPLQKRETAKGHPVLDFAAGTTSFLVYAKALDDRRDGRKGRAFFIELFFRSGAKKFSQNYPRLEAKLKTFLAEAWRREKEVFPGLAENTPKIAEEAARELAGYSGKMLAEIFLEGAKLTKSAVFDDERYFHTLGLFATYLGEWVYLIDAFDDWEEDRKKGNFNPFFNLPREEAYRLAEALLQEKIQRIDHTAALFPYYKDAGLLENILHLGLRAQVRQVKKKKEYYR